jgi:hypothetical protein
MERISERISAAVTGEVRCPACGKYVRPGLPQQNAGGEAATTDSGRWSFVWRDPSGVVCPECSFPLARYEKRLKWIRAFGVGVVLLTVAFLMYVLAKMTVLPVWFDWAVRSIAGVGLLAFLTGLVGLVIGGRSGPPSSEPPGAA